MTHGSCGVYKSCAEIWCVNLVESVYFEYRTGDVTVTAVGVRLFRVGEGGGGVARGRVQRRAFVVAVLKYVLIS
jgi:hypothetical protein